MASRGAGGLLARAWGAVGLKLSARGGGDERARLGLLGERHAARCLRRRGYRVLQSRALPGGVEVDLFCEAPDRRTLVVVEVKTRRPSVGGRAPELSVGAAKRVRLQRAVGAVRRHPRCQGRPVRADVVAIDAIGDRRRDWVVRVHEDVLR